MNKRLFLFLAIIIIAIAVVVSQLLFGKNSLKQQRSISKEIAVYQHQIDSLQKIIDSRNIEIERLKNDSLYKEEILRTKYGMSLKGEKVFQLVR